MSIKEKFLTLTSKTYPHGKEEELFPILFNIVSDLQKDEFGNLFIKIGESDVMFTSHLDTATSAESKVNHVFDGNIIKTDGTSILGADDKAGVTIMLHMIQNSIPGLYYFFLGEEVGCIGSKKVAEVQKKEKIEGINKVISFDRRGTTSVITYQSSKRCASDAFGQALAEQLNKSDETFEYKIDPTGVLTDSIQFISIYPECTNISVGYQSEHTFSESQDINHLEKLAEACLKVDWNGLPVERDPSKIEYRSYEYDSTYGSYGRYGRSYGGWGSPGWDDDYYHSSKYTSYNNFSTTKPVKDKTENVWFHDVKYNYVSNIVINSYTKKVVSVDLCKERIKEEKLIIDSFLKSLELFYQKSEWNGIKLKVTYSDTHSTECDRNDLIEFIPELDYSNIEELGETYGEYNDMCDSFYD